MHFTAASPAPQGRSWFGTAASGSINDLVITGRVATAAKQRLLEDWWQTAQHDLLGTVMFAHRRADVRDLNTVLSL